MSGIDSGGRCLNVLLTEQKNANAKENDKITGFWTDYKYN